MGKDILEIFNSSLHPDENYYDLLLYTFDLITTTVICRTGELAPTLNDTSKIPYVVTLGKLKIHNT